MKDFHRHHEVRVRKFFILVLCVLLMSCGVSPSVPPSSSGDPGNAGTLRPTPSFGLARPTAQAVVAGQKLLVPMSALPSGGFGSDVVLILDQPPTGFTAAPLQLTAGGTQPYSGESEVSVASTVPAGTYGLTFKGSSGALSVTTSVQVTVTVPPSFTLRLASPVLRVQSGQNTDLVVTVVPGGVFAGPVDLMLLGAPSGIGGTLSLAAGTLTGTLALSVNSSVAPGTYEVMVHSSAGPLNADVPLSLTVSSAPVPPFLAVNMVEPSVGVRAGDAVSVVIFVQRSGDVGPVQVSLDAAPPGISAVPLEIPADAVSGTLTLQTGTQLPPGPLALQVNAKSGTLTAHTTLGLIVTPSTPPTFTVRDIGNVWVTIGGNRDVSVQAGAAYGFDSDITLSLEDPPTGLTARGQRRVGCAGPVSRAAGLPTTWRPGRCT